MYRIANAATTASSFDTVRGLFQLRARGACVIRLAAMRLETPDHPLLGTISLLLFFNTLESLAMFVSRQRLHVGNRIAFVNNLSA